MKEEKSCSEIVRLEKCVFCLSENQVVDSQYQSECPLMDKPMVWFSERDSFVDLTDPESHRCCILNVLYA